MKTIFILLDSLNRHYLSAYQSTWVQTPNIERLANKGAVFDRHYSGSLPCMPARRELMTGRLNFLEARWSPLQPFDETYPEEIREQSGTYSHMITDHYHYFENNGSGYHTPFNTWEFIRGQEGDPWRPKVKDPAIPVYRGRNHRQDWVNREFMDLQRDEDYPTPQCFKRAIDFIEDNHDQDNWHLHLEVFDPHEPFLCPRKYVEMYEDDWDQRYHFDWPSYAPVDPQEEGADAIRHIRACYAATLTMADAWLGKLLDKMDQYHMWEDTTVILTTDHGYLLGDHGYWAKRYMFDYQKQVHIPLILYHPESKMNGRRIQALTTTIDLMPTILELNGAIPSDKVQGKSLLHLLQKDETHHDAILYGYFAKDINLTDGVYTYCRQALPNSFAYHHTATPVISDHFNLKFYEQAEVGVHLPQTDMSVYRVPIKSSRHRNAPNHHLLFNVQEDPEQTTPIHDDQVEQKYVSKMKELLERYQSPYVQLTRTGLIEGVMKE